MLILPDRNAPVGKFLLPQLKSEWRAPSLAQPKDQFGNENRTRFRLTARLDDGHVVWRGWFDDREDFDAFLLAIAEGTLGYERALWDLPTPAWRPGIAEYVWYAADTVVPLTASPGSNQTWTVPSDYDSAHNTIHAIGGGGSGAVVGDFNSRPRNASGGAGGGYGKYVNLTLTPGGSVTYNVGNFGASVTVTSTSQTIAGNNGGDTYFNGSTYAGASVGGLAGAGGNGNVNGSSTAVTGQSGKGTASATGGGTGAATVTGANRGATGGGGAASPSGNGVASSGVSGAGVSASAGGNSGSGATGGAGSTAGAANNGGNGTEIDGTRGAGAGSGGSTASNAAATSGTGGNYGGGSGGAVINNGSNAVTSGNAAQGAIVVIYTPRSSAMLMMFR